MPRKPLLWIVAALCLAGACFCGFKLWQAARDYAASQTYYEETAAHFVATAPPVSTPPVTATPSIQHSAPTPEPVPTPEPLPITVDFDSLRTEYPDLVGWLYEQDSINLPVLQADDNQYYLHRLPDGSYSGGGSLFMDHHNYSDMSDDVSFIYGHNMKNGSMFHFLQEYKSQSYYESHPVIYYLTPEKSYRVLVFAGMAVPSDSDVFTHVFATKEAKEAYLDGLTDASDIVPLVVPTAEDNILALSTCDYSFSDARYVVFGILTEIS